MARNRPSPSAEDLGNALNAAASLHAEGRLSEAEAIYTHVLRYQPHNADALNMVGVLSAQTGNHRRARELLKAAIEVRADQAEYWFNLGTVLAAQGDPSAEEAFGRALALDPSHLPAQVNLGHVLLGQDRFETAAECFEAALSLEPNQAEVCESLGVALQRQQRFDAAAAAFRRAIAINPDSATAPANYGTLLIECGHAEDAVAQLRAANERMPNRPDLLANLGVALQATGDHAGAIVAYDAALSVSPSYARAIGCKGLALYQLGDAAGANEIFDYDRLLIPTQVSAVSGYETVEAFNQALARHVLEHPTLMMGRPSKTTRHGGQTGELLVDRRGPANALEQVLRTACETYFETVAGRPGGGHTPRPPVQWRLSAWGTVLRTGGYQDPHYHPSGIISGVYYVRLPTRLDAGKERHQGGLEFGHPPANLNITAMPPRRMVMPQEGALVLFPSYFWHRTIPFHGDETRISIAFDLVPQSESDSRHVI